MQEMELHAVYVIDADPESFIRRMACDALGVDEVDLSGVTFVTDPEGFTLATGKILRLDRWPTTPVIQAAKSPGHRS